MENKYPIYHYDLIQQTPEWFKLRELKMTASHGTAIGNAGKGLETYIYQLVSEYYSTAERVNYTNKDLERGNELEPQARSIYELETGNEVKEVGFVEYNKYVGCSPDGLVGKDGGVEIKCPNDVNYFKMLLNGESAIDSTYKWQVQNNLLVIGRKWFDLVFYNPNFNKSILIYRIYPGKIMQTKLQGGFVKGEIMIKNLIKKVKKQ